ncbi:MAG: relaxase/mobilization nuclease domain-containing protein, partial [Aestuariivirga sp.]
MIIKGTSRAAPDKLAKHLLRADTNERVEVLEFYSADSDLAETLREWQLLASGTHGTKGLYHANIDPDARYAMTPEQWQRAVDVLEAELGFNGQPRVIVLHEKYGRQHLHVVWQRTDVDTMTLRSDSWNYLAHERASMALEKEFGHEHVPGKHAKRDRDKQPEFPRAETTHDEWQQSERSAIHHKERKAAIAKLYEQSDTGTALKAALEHAGYILAQGNQRDFVIVDADGQIHSLGRQLKGIKAKELRDFMANVDREKLPTAEQAKELQIENEKKRQAEPQSTEQPTPSAPEKLALTSEEIAALERAVADRHAKEAQKLKNLQSAERNQLRSVLDIEIAQKLADTDTMQAAERKRQHKKIYPEHVGIAGFIEAVIDRLNPKAAADAKAERDRQWEALIARQQEQRTDQRDSLNHTKHQEIDNLDERHAQKLREHELQSDNDLARYIREEENARRFLAEARERQKQLED